MTPQKIRRVCAYIVLALAIITLFTASLTLGRYSGEINSTGTYPGDMEFIVSDQIEVFSEEQFFSAIENGYSNIKISDEVENPLIITSGVTDVGADLILAFEKLEALRYAHYLKPGGEVLYSTQEIMPMPVVTGAAEYPQGIEAQLKGTGIDALQLALEAGNSKSANSVMLGALCKKLGLDRDRFEEALLSSIPQKTIEMNRKAFALGYDAA